MFTGITTHTPRILDIQGGLYTIENLHTERLHIGQSISHDGACMTITSLSTLDISSIPTPVYTFFAVAESISVTTLGHRKIGDRLNTELCMKIWDRIDGHIVSGHIDTVGTIEDIQIQPDGAKILYILYPTQYSMYVISKWSICINGVSLTVVHDSPGRLSIWIIPHTQSVTNLGTVCTGDSVNLEYDMMAKYIHKNNQLLNIGITNIENTY